MKRSIISLCAFVILVIFGVCSESIYTRILADDITAHTENFDGEKSSKELISLFEKRKVINRIFLRENIIERFEIYFVELEVFSKTSNNEGIESTLKKIKIFTDDLYEGRTF